MREKRFFATKDVFDSIISEHAFFDMASEDDRKALYSFCLCPYSASAFEDFAKILLRSSLVWTKLHEEFDFYFLMTLIYGCGFVLSAFSPS